MAKTKELGLGFQLDNAPLFTSTEARRDRAVLFTLVNSPPIYIWSPSISKLQTFPSVVGFQEVTCLVVKLNAARFLRGRPPSVPKIPPRNMLFPDGEKLMILPFGFGFHGRASPTVVSSAAAYPRALPPMLRKIPPT